MKIRTTLSAATAGVMALSVSLVGAGAAHAAGVTPGSFQTVEATRILDTRSGLGAPEIPLAAGGTLTFAATAGIDVPISSVVLNVTAVHPRKAGFLTVWAAGSPRPNASNLNFQDGQNVPNLVVAPVGQGGRVSIFNGSGGTVDLLADIDGFFVAGASPDVTGTFVSMVPRRFLDTRNSIGTPTHRVAAHAITRVRVAGVRGVPATATAVAVNVTAVQGGGPGYLTAYAGSPIPLASTVNYRTKQNRANMSLLAIDADDGTISIANGSNFAVDLLADVSGYFVAGDPANQGVPSTDGAFLPSTPFRLFDSRGPGGRPAGALTTSRIQIFPPDDDTFSVYKAVVVNVTAAVPEASGFLTTWEGVGGLPSLSSTNFLAKQDASGSIVLPVNPDGTISVFNGSDGNVHLVVDVSGFFLKLPAQMPNTRTPNGATPSKDRIAAALSTLKHLSNSPASVAVSVTRSH